MRLLIAVVAVELLLIALVHWWPNISFSSSEPIIYDTRGQETIALEEIQPTRQAQKPPPPPPPLIPVVVDDDIIIEEEIELEDQFLVLEEYADNLFEETKDVVSSGEGQASMAPEVGPKPMRFVEPEFTKAAQRRRIRADVVVEVLVDEKGLVREAKIVERLLYSGSDDTPKPVPELKYGLEESAITAAKRWMFQPARQDGIPVASYKTITFSFGK